MFPDAASAYAEAVRRIAVARASSAPEIEFDLGALEQTPSELADLQSVRRLTLCGSRVSDLGVVGALAQLCVLDISRTNVVDLRPLARCPKLNYLWLDRTAVVELSGLRGARELRGLSINDTNIACIDVLSGMSGLIQLNARNTPQLSEISALAAAYGLERLYLSKSNVSDLRPVARANKLLSLSIADTPVDDLQSISAMPMLQDIDVSGISSLDLCQLTECHSLTALRAQRTGALVLSALPHSLRGLDVAGSRVCDISGLSGRDLIWSLDIAHTQVTDPSPLARMPGLLSAGPGRTIPRGRLCYLGAPFAREEPFASWAGLHGHRCAVETVTYLARSSV